jgi:hypothetical protein
MQKDPLDKYPYRNPGDLQDEDLFFSERFGSFIEIALVASILLCYFSILSFDQIPSIVKKYIEIDSILLIRTPLVMMIIMSCFYCYIIVRLTTDIFISDNKTNILRVVSVGGSVNFIVKTITRSYLKGLNSVVKKFLIVEALIYAVVIFISSVYTNILEVNLFNVFKYTLISILLFIIITYFTLMVRVKKFAEEAVSSTEIM